MTISDIAKTYGVSQQAVYQRLKRKGVKLKDIQKANSQELTEEGEALFKSMFQQVEQSPTMEETAIQQIDALTRENESLRNKIKDLEHEIELQKTALEDKGELLRRADEEINFLRLNVSQAQETVSRTTLLLESERQKQTGGLLARLLRKENTK